MGQSTMSNTEITYDIRLDDEQVFSFHIDVARELSRSPDFPTWAALPFHQCPNCPLDQTIHRACPAAADLAPIVTAFSDVPSTTRVTTRVTTNNRVVEQRGDLQGALRSLIGLVMPTSGCPVLAKLKGLARFHLPFADRDETVFRVVGSYLVTQYLVALDGGEPDWELAQVREHFKELARVDTAFAGRMRNSGSSDASVNALVALFSMATLVSMSLDQDLARVRSRLEPDSHG